MGILDLMHFCIMVWEHACGDQGMECHGLNENDPHRLIYLNTCSQRTSLIYIFKFQVPGEGTYVLMFNFNVNDTSKNIIFFLYKINYLPNLEFLCLFNIKFNKKAIRFMA